MLVAAVCAFSSVSVIHNARGAEPKSHRSSPKAARSHSKKTLGNPFSGLTSSTQRKQVIESLPLNRLTPQARKRIRSIADSPTIYRRLPTQAISCDRDMFLFLTRNPETLVGIWDLMGITKVKSRRTGPYRIEAVDGAGTTCTIDLIYGDAHTHIFIADGSYDGSMTTKPIRGSGVIVLRSNYARSANGHTTVTGSIDCFVRFDNLGADLVARTLSGIIGRSADNNFIETARFIAQVNQAAEKNVAAMVDVAERLPQVDLTRRRQFAQLIETVSQRHHAIVAAQQNQNLRSPPFATPTVRSSNSMHDSNARTATTRNPMRRTQ